MKRTLRILEKTFMDTFLLQGSINTMLKKPTPLKNDPVNVESRNFDKHYREMKETKQKQRPLAAKTQISDTFTPEQKAEEFKDKIYAALVNSEKDNRLVDLYEDMQAAHLPFMTICGAVLARCRENKQIPLAEFLYNSMLKKGLQPTPSVYHEMHKLYKVGKNTEKSNHFKNLFKESGAGRQFDPELRAFCSELYAIARSSQPDTAILEDFVLRLENIQGQGINPEQHTYGALIAYAIKCDLDAASSIFKQFLATGQQPNVIMFTTLIQGFSNNFMMTEAMHYFILMKEYNVKPNSLTYERLIHGYALLGEYNLVFAIIDNMVKSNILLTSDICNTILSSAAREYPEIVFKVLDLMVIHKVERTRITYNVFMKSLEFHHTVENEEKIFKALSQTFTPNIQSVSKMINYYSVRGEIEKAFDFYLIAKKREVPLTLYLFEKLIYHLARCGKIELVGAVKSTMISLGIKPEITTDLAEFRAFCFTDQMDLAMEKFYSVPPHADLYFSMLEYQYQQKDFEGMEQYFNEMISLGVPPKFDHIRMMIVGAYSIKEAIGYVELYYKKFEKFGIPVTGDLLSTLIHMSYSLKRYEKVLEFYSYRHTLNLVIPLDAFQNVCRVHTLKKNYRGLHDEIIERLEIQPDLLKKSRFIYRLLKRYPCDSVKLERNWRT